MIDIKKRSKKHKLVAIGDSMAQGFKNGGIYRTDLSFPALVARSLEGNFKMQSPSFSAQTGIPVNMELLVRGLEERFGDELRLRHYPAAAAHTIRTLRRIKRYWEGNMAPLSRDHELPYHNQAIWGLSTSDVWLMNEAFGRNYIKDNPPSYTVFSALPDHALYITARLVLNPALTEPAQYNSMIDNVQILQDNGGVENLICCVGHNSIVGAVTKLKLIYSEEKDLETFHARRNCTVFRPEHFEHETRMLYEKISGLGVDRVFVPTIPYVTIPPATRGVNINGEKKGGYYDYYSRFWIWDEDFNPDKHPHLTREDAIILDQHVDLYNESIRKLAAEFDFHVVPVHKHVKAAARRRLGYEKIEPFPPQFVEAIRNNNKTTHLIDENGKLRLSSDFIRLNEYTMKLDRGGMFSLDGLHPTTIGYGLIANLYLQTMKAAGVAFSGPIDWDFVIENDTLVTDPPKLLDNLRVLLRFLALGHGERFTLLSQNLLQQLLELFSPGPDL